MHALQWFFGLCIDVGEKLDGDSIAGQLRIFADLSWTIVDEISHRPCLGKRVSRTGGVKRAKLIVGPLAAREIDYRASDVLHGHICMTAGLWRGDDGDKPIDAQYW